MGTTGLIQRFLGHPLCIGCTKILTMGCPKKITMHHSKKLMIGIILATFFFVTGIPLQASQAIETKITYSKPFSNPMTTLEYLPPRFSPHKRTPLIIGLHGMAQTPESAYKHWKKAAKNLGAILICPKGSNFQQGFTRSPVDDRKRLVELVDLMKIKYRIDEDHIYLGGFSRGGNFAIETSLLYPDTFPYVICLFGFFNKGIEKNIPIGPLSRYKHSKYYLITGKKDITETSMNFGKLQLDKYLIQNKLHTYENVHHAYPADFKERIKAAITWFNNKD